MPSAALGEDRGRLSDVLHGKTRARDDALMVKGYWQRQDMEGTTGEARREPVWLGGGTGTSLSAGKLLSIALTQFI